MFFVFVIRSYIGCVHAASMHRNYAKISDSNNLLAVTSIIRHVLSTAISIYDQDHKSNQIEMRSTINVAGLALLLSRSLSLAHTRAHPCLVVVIGCG